MAVAHVMAGAVTPTGATVAAKATAGDSVRLAASLSALLTAPTYFGPVVADAFGYVKVAASGLSAGTDYHYGLEVNGVLDAIRGRFRTFPTEGAATDVTVAFGSCWIVGEDHKPALRIEDRAVDLFIQCGDFGYLDILASQDETLWHAGWDAILATVNIPDLLQRHALAYVWDDHDYGVNNSNKTYFGRAAASAAVRRMFPLYPLPAGETGDNPIYQAFSIGRVRFILTDLRHQRDNVTMDTQGPSSSMLGATQKAWFKQELVDSRARGDGLIVWVSSNVYIADQAHQPTGYTADDSWAEFTAERIELADFMVANDIDNLCILHGDQHALSIDSGRHADYATGGGSPLPVFGAAPLGRIGGNRKGGPYDYESRVSSADSHYGLVRISDDGYSVVVDWEGWAVNDTTGVQTLIYSHRFTRGGTARAIVHGGVLTGVGGPVTVRA